MHGGPFGTRARGRIMAGLDDWHLASPAAVHRSRDVVWTASLAGARGQPVPVSAGGWAISGAGAQEGSFATHRFHVLCATDGASLIPVGAAARAASAPMPKTIGMSGEFGTRLGAVKVGLVHFPSPSASLDTPVIVLAHEEDDLPT